MNEQLFSKDAKDFLRLLAKYDVRYLVIGGIAVIYHGHARRHLGRRPHRDADAMAAAGKALDRVCQLPVNTRP